MSDKTELELLKERADKMGISYHPSIGVDKLRDKVNAAMEGKKVEDDEAPAEQKVVQLTAMQERNKKRKEAAQLVRIRVTCFNPAKKEWQGELFTAGNGVVGSFRKYVPFDAEDGWHVPRIIYNMIKNRKCQVFVTTKDDRGNTYRKGKLINEFAVEELKPLNQVELDKLAAVQAANHSIDTETEAA